jgi:FkbM family methyltransferase
VLWIKANPDKHSQIQSRISGIQGMSSGHFAAGSSDGVIKKLSISSNSQSSSLLEFGTHSDHHPSVKFTKEIEGTIRRIDDYLAEEGIPADRFNMMCLDIQGYELEELRGASRILNPINFVYSEVNRENVYVDCPIVHEVDTFLACYGFKRITTAWTSAGW